MILRRLNDVLFTLTIASLVVSVPRAQAPSAWAELVPPGGVDPAKLVVLTQAGVPGKLLLYRDGQFLRVFSTITGQWHAHTPSLGTTPVLFEDILLVPESDRWTALSAARGVFEPLILGSLVPLHPLSTGRFVFLQVGNTVHYFAAAIGSWRSRQVPANGSVVARGAGEQLIVFSGPTPSQTSPGFSGCEVYDTFADTWYTLPPQPGVTMARGGFTENAGCLLFQRPDSTTYAATFTTMQPAWNIRPVQAVPPLFNLGGGGGGGADFITVWNIAYSGLTDTLTELSLPVAPATGGFVSLGFDSQAQRYHVLGILGQSYQQLPAGASTQFREGVFGLRIFGEGTQSFAVNGRDGSIAAVACDQGQFPSGGHQGVLVGAVADRNTRVVSVYSAATGQWHPLPAGVQPEPFSGLANPQLYGSAASVLLLDTNGIVAFSGRTGAFVPLAGTGLTRWAGFVARDPGAVHAFDARTDRWLSAPVAAAAVQHNESGFITASGNRAVAFGVATSRLEAVDLPEPSIVGHDMLDGGAFAFTTNRILGFRGLPPTRSGATFPDGVMANVPGSQFRCQTVLPTGAIALLALSNEMNTPIDLPPFGELWLDPATAVPFGLISAPQGELRVRTAFAIPNVPTLHGTEWTLQSLVLAPLGQPYLTPFTGFRVL